jgi:hypothetical protein
VYRPRPDEGYLFRRVARHGVTVERVEVEGAEGFWIEGGPHELIYLEEGGGTFTERARLAGNTLLWSADGITYRVESALSKDRVLEIAESAN